MEEIYQGIKFNYISIGKTISQTELLPELKYWCAVFNQKNLAPAFVGGSSGNLSFRLQTGKVNFIITASHTELKKDMPDSDFSEVLSCDKNDNLIVGKGIKKPSSESIMHFLIYKNRPDINAIFHGHSPDILEFADKLNLPVTQKEFPYGTINSSEEATSLAKKNNFFILKNHGFIALGKTMQDSGEQTKSILKQCKSIK